MTFWNEPKCSIRAGGEGLSAQWWVDRQKAVPIGGPRRFIGRRETRGIA